MQSHEQGMNLVACQVSLQYQRGLHALTTSMHLGELTFGSFLEDRSGRGRCRVIQENVSLVVEKIDRILLEGILV